MKKFFLTTLLLAVLLTCVNVFAAARFQILAPAEESFIGMEQVLIIGIVDGSSVAKMVEVSGNGKTMGFAPLQNGSFNYKTTLADGRHEITLSAPGVERKTVRIFVGKQEGYRYHIEPEVESCESCHARAGDHVFKVEPMEGDLCNECHDPMGTKKFVHGPVAASSCTPCHDPHGSRYDKFLVSLGKNLCLVCHSQNLSKKHVEERQNANCVRCHDPHGSDKEYHLR